MPNNATSIARVGTAIYLGATTQLAPYNGPAVRFRSGNGYRLPRSVELPAAVTAAVGDGKGGFYVATLDERSRAVRVAELRHVLADGSVEPRFQVKVGGVVHSLALHAGRLYLGGSFRTVRGAARRNAAAVTAATGSLLGWSPKPNGPVRVLAVAGGRVFLGGNFERLGRLSRNDLAAVSALSGKVLPWSARIRIVEPDSANFGTDAYVEALVVAGRTLYVGGYFDRARGRHRASVAALDVHTAQLRRWDPPLADPGQGVPAVTSFALGAGLVFIGGYELHGFASGLGLIAVDPGGGKRRWGRSRDSSVEALLFDGKRLLASEELLGSRGAHVSSLRALNPKSGRATIWDIEPNDTVAVLARSGDTVLGGGAFSALGGAHRGGAGAIDALTGAATKWDAGTDGFATEIAQAGDTLYLAGPFKRFGGLPHNHIAAVNGTTGATLPWEGALPVAGGQSVDALAVAGDKVFAAVFDKLHAIDIATRARRTSTVKFVEALAGAGPVVYLAGSFTSIGGVARKGLAAIDSATGTVLPWNPNIAGYWTAVAVSGDSVYAGRSGRPFSSEPGNGEVVALSAATGAARWRVKATFPRVPYDPEDAGPGNMEPQVNGLSLEGTTLYVGGRFNAIGAAARAHAAALDAGSGAVLPWHPLITPLEEAVSAIDADHDGVTIAGSFSTVGGVFQPGFARFGMH